MSLLSNYDISYQLSVKATSNSQTHTTDPLIQAKFSGSLTFLLQKLFGKFLDLWLFPCKSGIKFAHPTNQKPGGPIPGSDSSVCATRRFLFCIWGWRQFYERSLPHTTHRSQLHYLACQRRFWYRSAGYSLCDCNG